MNQFTKNLRGRPTLGVPNPVDKERRLQIKAVETQHWTGFMLQLNMLNLGFDKMKKIDAEVLSKGKKSYNSLTFDEKLKYRMLTDE